MSAVRINLVPNDEYEKNNYGIILVSETEHDFRGPGIHARGHAHRLQVWDNSRRVQPDGLSFRDPRSRITTSLHSFLWSPRTIVITAHPDLREQTPRGEVLEIGGRVELYIQDFRIDEYVIEARSLDYPHLTPAHKFEGAHA